MVACTYNLSREVGKGGFLGFSKASERLCLSKPGRQHPNNSVLTLPHFTCCHICGVLWHCCLCYWCWPSCLDLGIYTNICCSYLFSDVVFNYISEHWKHKLNQEMIGISQENYANYVVDKSSNSPKIKRALSTSTVVHICDPSSRGRGKRTAMSSRPVRTVYCKTDLSRPLQ